MTHKDEKTRMLLLLTFYCFCILVSVLLLAVGIWRNTLILQIAGGLGIVVSLHLTLERWHLYTHLPTEETPRHKVKVMSGDSQ